MVALGFVPVATGVIPPPLNYVGGALIVLGVLIASVAARQFFKAETTIRPFETSSALVTHGCFGFSRNPMPRRTGMNRYFITPSEPLGR